MLSHCVPLLSHTGWWRTWRMKLQTALSSWATGQNKSCPGYPWYPAVGFFDSSGSVLGDLSYLTKSHQHETKTQNGIYPRPSGQTVGLHYFFIGSSKSCSTIMRGWTKSKQHIQHTQTHTSLQICTSKKKRLPKWEVFHQHLIFLHFPPCFRTKNDLPWPWSGKGYGHRSLFGILNPKPFSKSSSYLVV